MAKDKYGVILDAGSSGTRIHVYRWDDPAQARAEAASKQKHELQQLPKLETKKKWTKKTHPGVSTFADKPHEVGSDHLAGLFHHASKIIPKKSQNETPLFLLATAGMRLLPETKRRELLNEICDYARQNTQFLLPDCDLHIQVIPGETEGLYGWIAANYIVGAFDDPVKHDHGKQHNTYGFLDMGGASAQIAFAPNATEAEKHANDLKLLRLRLLDGTPVEHRVFVTTWLGFGVNEARKRYVERLIEASAADGVEELPDPCLPRGLRQTTDGELIEDLAKHDGSVHLVGTGVFSECERQVYPLLDKDKPCLDKPCLLNGQHVPAIDFDVNHFIGVSEYWHTTHRIFEDKHAQKAYDFATYQERVSEYCETEWSEIEESVAKKKWGKDVDDEKAMQICFKASWLINVLHDGIGIPRIGIEPNAKSSHNGTLEVVAAAQEMGFLNPFQPVDKIGEVEVSWTLGRMVLYAASQVPGDNKVPVGFGDNVPHADTLESFQFGGSGPPATEHHVSVPLPANSPAPSPVPASNKPATPAATGNYSTSTQEENIHWHDTLWREGGSAPRRVPGIILFLLMFTVAALLLIGRERRSRLFRLFIGRRRKLPGSTVAYERIVEEGGRGSLSPPRFELGSFATADSSSDDEWDHRRKDIGSSVSSRIGLGDRTDSRERLRGMSRNVSPERGARARSPLPPRRNT